MGSDMAHLTTQAFPGLVTAFKVGDYMGNVGDAAKRIKDILAASLFQPSSCSRVFISLDGGVGAKVAVPLGVEHAERFSMLEARLGELALDSLLHFTSR